MNLIQLKHHMNQICDKTPFGEYFNILGMVQQKHGDIINYQYIIKFIALMQDCLSIDEKKELQQICEQSNNYVIKQIGKSINSTQQGNQIYNSMHLRDGIQKISEEQKQEQIFKILKKCFIIATHCKNSSYFISKIMELSENSQLYFAQLLKPLCPTSPSSFTNQKYQNPQFNNSYTRPHIFSTSNGQIQIIDKLYEYQQQIQRLTQELRKANQYHGQTYEQNQQMKIQLKNIRSENQSYKMKILDLQQMIDNIKIYQQQTKAQIGGGKKQIDNDINNIGNKSILQLKDEIDILRIKNENIRRKYQNTINQLHLQLKKQSQKTHKYKQKSIDYKQSHKQLTQRYEQIKSQLESIINKVTQLQSTNQILQQNQATLKFQLNYKNSQIQQLKQLLMNNSLTNRDQSGDYFIENKSKLLQNQFDSNSNSYFHSTLTEDKQAITQNLVKLNKREADELRSLRAAVKQYQKQIQSLHNIKTRNKQLQYQKKKLLKIIKEYEGSRGEQNDIIVGCLYEVRNQMLAKLQQATNHNKQIASMYSNLTQDNI